jgi:hypothetical protein
MTLALQRSARARYGGARALLRRRARARCGGARALRQSARAM